mgnify:CR=1 FL=1
MEQEKQLLVQARRVKRPPGRGREMNRDLQDLKMQLQIDSWGNRAALIAAAIPVVRQFDDKVYNCRFDETLRTLSVPVAVQDDKRESCHAYVTSYYSDKRRYIVFNTEVWQVVSGQSVQPHDRECCCMIEFTDPGEGKQRRIDGKATETKLRGLIANLKKRVQKTIAAREKLEQAEELVKQADELIKQANELVNAGEARYTFEQTYSTGWKITRGVITC